MSHKIKCLIVDDEPLAQRIIEKYAEDIPTIEIIAKCNNAFEAMQALNDLDIDLMFLDINMPKLSGINFLKTLIGFPWATYKFFPWCASFLSNSVMA